MYIESKYDLAGQVISINRLDELVSKIEDAVSPVSQAKVFSVSHARVAVMAVAREYREFQVWAGDMCGPRTFVVTIWEDWVADGDKREHFVRIFIPEGMIVS